MSNTKPSLDKLVSDSNVFAFRLFAQLAQNEPASLFLSPSSISAALAMTYAGAAGETAKEFETALGYSLQGNDLHQAYQELAEVTRTGGIEFRTANRLWGQTGYHFLEEFLRTTETSYGAGLGEVDYQHATEAACLEINSWVEEQTAGRIKDLVSPRVLDETTRLVLTNAVYFLGNWHDPFDEQHTRDEDFVEASGATSVVSMMHKTSDLRYGESASVKLLELPYQSYGTETRTVMVGGEPYEEVIPTEEGGSDFAMLILLPTVIDGIDDLTRDLATGGFAELPPIEECEVRVAVPKFRMESAFSLGDQLQAMGLRQAFSDDADFSKMTDNPMGLKITEVIHQAFVEVSEEGTEAAAATGVMMAAECAFEEPPVPKVFRADHPFVFLIRDNATKLIHFIGRYMGPDEP